MRILLLSTGGKIGGEEVFTRNLALSLTQKGHYVEVCTGGDIQKDDLIAHGIPICEIDITGRTPRKIIMTARQLTDYVVEYRFDIVHAQAVGPALMGVFAKKLFKCKIPWIWHNHGISKFAYRFIVPILDNLNMCISNSDYVYVMLRNHGISLEKCKRIHNGIDYNYFETSHEEQATYRQEVVKEYNIPKTDQIITYIGRLSPEKGVKYLLTAFKKEYESSKNISLLIVGDGVEKSSLVNSIRNTEIEKKVHFTGFRTDVKKLLSASDLLVLPSKIETFGLSITQAFAVGVSVVASDIGGVPEQVLDNFNGLLFTSEYVDDLKDKIHIVLHSKELMDRYTKNAKALCKNYLNIDRMTNEIFNVYSQLIVK